MISNSRKKAVTGLTIVRAKVRSLVFYEITEDELSSLEKGGVQSLLLNFGVFFLSAAISLITALFTAQFASDRVYYSFCIVSVISIISAIVLLALWLLLRKRKSQIIQRIRGRLK